MKTSTGFSSGGASVEDVRRLVAIIQESDEFSAVKVKASGGIRTGEAALEMVRAGAERLGTSRSVAIAEEISRIQTSNDNLY